MSSVREFGHALTGKWGAPRGLVETFIEVPFKLGDRDLRPDGLIRVSKGKSEWIALVEVKVGSNGLDPKQVEDYLDIAKDRNFDAVVTVSQQLTVTPGVHPVSIDGRKTRKVQLHHISWSRIHTEALIEQVNHAVSDPDQAYILSEFIRYLEHDNTGTLDFNDMGAQWIALRDGSRSMNLNPMNSEVNEGVARFDQLVSFCGMQLSRKLGVHVMPRLTKSERSDHAKRLKGQIELLIRSGQLTGSLEIPNAVSPIELIADLRAGRVIARTEINAPTDRRATARINWLLGQLKNAPSNLSLTANVSHSRSPGLRADLSTLRDNPAELISSNKDDIRSFVLELSGEAGTKRKAGQGSFIDSVSKLVDEFYFDVVLGLKKWVPSAPKSKVEPLENAIVPPMNQYGVEILESDDGDKAKVQ